MTFSHDGGKQSSVPAGTAAQSISIGFIAKRLPEETRLPFAIESHVSPFFTVYERPDWQVGAGVVSLIGVKLGVVTVPLGSPHAVGVSIRVTQ